MSVEPHLTDNMREPRHDVVVDIASQTGIGAQEDGVAGGLLRHSAQLFHEIRRGLEMVLLPEPEERYLFGLLLHLVRRPGVPAHDIPVIENKPLARALFKMCDVGQFVPGNLYRAVAEVLAYVYRLKGKVLR